MKPILSLCLLLISFISAGYNTFERFSISVEGKLLVKMESFQLDDKNNLYVLCSLFPDYTANGSEKAIFHYPNGSDTVQYKYKSRLHLVKINSNGNYKRFEISIEDSLPYDFGHTPTNIKIINNKLYFGIERVINTGTLLVNDEKIPIENVNSEDLFMAMVFNMQLKLLKAQAFGNNLGPTFFANLKSPKGKPAFQFQKSGFEDLFIGNKTISGKFPNVQLTELVLDSNLIISELIHLPYAINSGFGNSRAYFQMFNSGLGLNNNVLFKYQNRSTKEFKKDVQNPGARFCLSNIYNSSAIATIAKDGNTINSFGQVQVFYDTSVISKSFQGIQMFSPISNLDQYLYFMLRVENIFSWQNEIIWKKQEEISEQGAFLLVKANAKLEILNIDTIAYVDHFEYKPPQFGFTEFLIPASNMAGSYFVVLDSCKIDNEPNEPSKLGFANNAELVLLEIEAVPKPKEKPFFAFQPINCNSGQFNFNSKDAEHYTVLLSTDSIKSFPVNGKNYNYSPDFFEAPYLKDPVKIMYQGPDTAVVLKNLVAGKTYFVAVVPGKGLPNFTLYNPDSAAFISFTLPKPIIAKPLIIKPKTDTATCQNDTLFAEAISDYTVRWMDGKTENTRFVPETGSYFFTIKDSQGCVVSSDTIYIIKNENPIISSLEIITEKPYCVGDTLEISAQSTGNYSWSSGEKTAQIFVSENGQYTLTSQSPEGCESSESIAVEFKPYPYFNFLEDSILSYDGTMLTSYKTNADSLIWIYQKDSNINYQNFAAIDGELLKIKALNNSGCAIWDSILTRYIVPQTEIFPNAFSPNGDGINDVWYFIHPDTAGTLIIYDRWGGIAHHGQNTWDGRKNGEICPIGAYRYVFVFKEDGAKKRREGVLFIIE